MLIIPIAALIFIGVSYFMANRFLPAPAAMKATPWMAGAALLGYLIVPFLFGIILTLVRIPTSAVALPIVFAVSASGALAAAGLVLTFFVRRHRRRRSEKEAQSTVF